MNLPISIKAVILAADSNPAAVLLLRNERDEWELPGGRLDPGEQPEATLLREVQEELGLAAHIERILDAQVLEVLPGRPVFIVTYACGLIEATDPTLSHEHQEWSWFAIDTLPPNLPDCYRHSILCAAGGRT